jgi:hypothetical protein
MAGKRFDIVEWQLGYIFRRYLAKWSQTGDIVITMTPPSNKSITILCSEWTWQKYVIPTLEHAIPSDRWWRLASNSFDCRLGQTTANALLFITQLDPNYDTLRGLSCDVLIVMCQPSPAFLYEFLIPSIESRMEGLYEVISNNLVTPPVNILKDLDAEAQLEVIEKWSRKKEIE